MNTPKGARSVGARSALRAGIAVLAGGIVPAVFAAPAAADATDDYPFPHRIIITTCTAEQILAAARDFTPIYYQRYIIDKHNKPPEVQQAAIDSAHYFYSLNPQDRRAHSEQMATNVADPMTLAWPNRRRSSSTTKASPQRKPTTALTTHATTNPSGTAEYPRRLASTPAWVLSGLVPRRRDGVGADGGRDYRDAGRELGAMRERRVMGSDGQRMPSATNTGPSPLVVNSDDMARASA